MSLSKLQPAGIFLLIASIFSTPGFAISVDEYAKWNDFGKVTMSPDGKYLAVERFGDINSTLLILDAESQKPLTEFALPPHQSVYGVNWANKDTLIFSRAQRSGGLETPRSYGEVIAMSADGKRTKYLYGALGDSSAKGVNKDEGWAKIINMMENDDENIVVLTTTWDNADELKNKQAIVKINVFSGKRDQIAISPINNPYVIFDLENKLRFVSGYDEDQYPVSYQYLEPKNQWKKIESGTSPFFLFQPLQFLPGNKDFLAEISDAGEPSCLYLVKSDNTKEQLHCEEGVDIGRLMPSSHTGLPLAIVSNSTNPKVVLLSADTEDARLYESISKSFPDEIVYLEDYSSDGARILFSVSSDSRPHRYYLYDRKSNISRLVLSTSPTLDNERSGNSTGFSFKARDGVTLHGVLTLPKNHVKGKTPMVVMPHGGPLGISDNWYFDKDAQWLAANGYAVLKINFRGSAGYGNAFIRKGYRTWGSDIQNDIIDATNFVINTQTVDKNKICIIGGSFGAYSALMNSILAPQTYQCAIGYAGVYDLSLMYRKGDIPETKTGLHYLDLVIGKDKEALAAQSPVSRAAEIKIPVLLIHGSDDWRTPLPQALRLKKAMADAGNTPEMLIVPNEGHGFVRTKNRIQYLTTLKSFLDKHIGPNKIAKN